MTELTGRVAIITGGSRGIGAAAGMALAKAGAAVMLVARDGAAASRVAGAIAGKYPSRKAAAPAVGANGIAKAIAAAIEAHEEEARERRSRWIKKGKAHLRVTGRHQGGRRPFGYRLVPASDGGASWLESDPAEQKAIVEILDLRRRGFSLIATREALRAKGHRICKQTVANICDRAAGKPLKPKSKARPMSRTSPAVSLPEPVAAPVVVETPAELQRMLSEIRADLARLTEQRAATHVHERNERESVQPILRRLTEIERHLRLTENPMAPRPSRRHPMGA